MATPDKSLFRQVFWTVYDDKWWPVKPLRVADLGDTVPPEAMGLEADVPPDEIEEEMRKRGTVPISFVGSGEISVVSVSRLEPLSADNMYRLDENDFLSTEAIERTRAFWAASSGNGNKSAGKGKGKTERKTLKATRPSIVKKTADCRVPQTDDSASSADMTSVAEHDSPDRSTGVVLPTSLLDALLRSVPAASVPPLLTATLLTPFLTADYATSLLRERCIIGAMLSNPEHKKLKELHRHCLSVLQSGSSTLSSDADNLQERRKPSQSEAETAARDASDDGAALLKERSEHPVNDAVHEFISAATTCVQEHLRIYCRSTSDRVSISKAIIHLPAFVDTGGRTHHAQFEISTTNHTGYREGDYYNSVETDEDWAVAIGFRCWSVHYEAPDRKRPRDEGSARPASVWYRVRSDSWDKNNLTIASPAGAQREGGVH